MRKISEWLSAFSLCAAVLLDRPRSLDVLRPGRLIFLSDADCRPEAEEVAEDAQIVIPARFSARGRHITEHAQQLPARIERNAERGCSAIDVSAARWHGDCRRARASGCMVPLMRSCPG